MADIHLSPIGSDVSGDGSMGNPYKTPAEAHSHASPGDNIIYHAGPFPTGVYYIPNEQQFDVNGTSGNPITHKPYQSGVNIDSIVISGLSGNFPTSTTALIDMSGNFQVLDGLHRDKFIIRDNSTGRGVSVDNDAIVQNLTVCNIGERAVGGGAHRWKAQNVHTFRYGMSHVSGTPAGWPGAIAPFSIGTGVAAAGVVITGCYIHDGWGEGIILLRATGCVVIGNIVHDTYSVGIYIDKCVDGHVEGNYVFATNPAYYKSGAFIKAINSASEGTSFHGPNTKIRIRNNILAGTDNGLRWFRDASNTTPHNYYSDVQFDHNIIYNPVSYAIDLDTVTTVIKPTGCFFRNNIFYKGTASSQTINFGNTGSWVWQNNIFANFTPPTLATGTNSFYNVNPALVNPVISGSVDGYALWYYSTGNRAGIPIAGLTRDFYGKTRNSIPTIGPYEIPPKPTGSTDVYTASFNTPLTVAASPSGVLANDYTSLSGTVDGYTAQTFQTGTIYISGSGAFRYTPRTGFAGTDRFTYTSTSMGGTGTSTGLITVNASTDPPVAVDDTYFTRMNQILTTGAPGLFNNDTLNDGALLGYDATTTKGGTVYVSGSGAFRYTPPNNAYGGQPDTFRYTLQNSNGTGTATVSINIGNVPPSLINKTYSMVKATTFTTGGVFGTGLLQSGTLVGFTDPTVNAGQADMNMEPNGAIAYTPFNFGGSQFFGTDFVNYCIQNSEGTGVATITFLVSNAPPVPVDDSYSTFKNIVLTGAAPGVLSNDTLNSGTITGYDATTTRGGSVFLSGSGHFRYVPPNDVTSPPDDTFRYTLINNVGTGTATVSITISQTAAASSTGITQGYGRFRRYWRYWRIQRI